MKIFLISIFAIFLLFKPTPIYEDCNIQTIKQDLPPITWFEQTIDGKNQPIWQTRFLHNKIGISSSLFANCYSVSLDPKIAFDSVGLVGVVFWLYFIYHIATKKKWAAIALFLLLPIIPPILDSGYLISYFYKIFAIIGLVYYLKRNA